ncbi:uncharacterized protein K452DRAFT_97655 [Aplosporella prunicola CBS 121167]|uniref:Uncharacterized protein n=1 Tax=Aplosporella prunicola CBS 121167 TaxID=1176127 RepID=A0A6A6B1L0_9PEZI|nr:uncharacterized protein K452DRAFT_97655 [Aplosporella prunicola CBS 121167]KAF2137706.1 hypothetical protein K452DRAFT_97655 [Aplosporella prunicola CBS 121167]
MAWPIRRLRIAPTLFLLAPEPVTRRPLAKTLNLRPPTLTWMIALTLSNAGLTTSLLFSRERAQRRLVGASMIKTLQHQLKSKPKATPGRTMSLKLVANRKTKTSIPIDLATRTAAITSSSRNKGYPLVSTPTITRWSTS